MADVRAGQDVVILAPRRWGGATAETLEIALTKVLRCEHSHFSLVWARASGVQRQLLQALAGEPDRPLSAPFRTWIAARRS